MDFKVDIRTQHTATKISPTNKKSRDLQNLKTSCQEFESIYVNEMLKTARKTIPEGGLFEKSNGTEIFEGMLDMEQARKISQNSSLGLANAMYKQMAHLIEDRKE
ncbi:rod-binding protein [Desulfotalea psychrophila]|uniref:Related to flagellar muramidase protein (FlgJ) n=1 Tax=Desulfotalea psychrophila (strain LSv54 / DSM 12343) TaxID=177439 RepID=Q6AJR6_DESPS|nr:rod-binding protein [Desulfotalea psychrophila]CAG37414.1 related to flagellar muramidase protein (FlgJ) [Desulfotalea psychrophila LSv54]